MDAARLAGRAAIVTGAARGIGAVYARALAAAGADVVIADVLESPGEALARELLATRAGARAVFVRTDGPGHDRGVWEDRHPREQRRHLPGPGAQEAVR